MIGVQQAGDVECKQVLLVDGKNSNTSYNLIGMFVDLTIYEDIFSPILTGYIALIESQNLIQTLPIVGGEEYLVIDFVTPSLDTHISKTFVITGVGLREHGDKKNSYVLEFISYEGFIDLNTRYAETFTGNTSTLLNQVFTKSFNSAITNSDTSNNNIKFVSPYWGALKVCNYITSHATTANSKILTPDYLFWQTCQSHNFKSLSNLWSQTPIQDYVFDKDTLRVDIGDGKTVRNIDREYKSVLKLKFVEHQDYMKNMINGAYNHHTFSANLFNKNFNRRDYNILNDFGKTSHASKYPLMSQKANISQTSGLHSIKHTMSNLFDGVSDINDEIIAKRVSILAQLETFKLNIDVHGRTDIQTGQVINFWLNPFKTLDESDKFNPINFDTLYSGKYLITALAHRFTMVKHQITMQVVKDSSYTAVVSQ